MPTAPDPEITGLVLGSYELLSPLAKGAMGEVWRARHRLSDTELAVKCLREAPDEWARSAFDTEVRATAGLHHPGIVMVLDHGEVDTAAAEASGGRLPDGSPYLVMELVDGRPLQAKVGRLAWPVVRDILLQLLGALAHSHARGVIHRDLKPGNVLISAAADGRLRTRITDFGLAQAVDQSASHERIVAGTPAYMAPEQLSGDWRDQGSWTDLYSLGCLGWALATSSPPFGRKRPFAQFCQDHLHRPPPVFEPQVEVPEAFESWLRRLLEKRPGERFTRAADAAEALRGLEESPMLPACEPRTDGDIDDLADGPVHFAAMDGDLDGDASTGAPRPLADVPDISTRRLEGAPPEALLEDAPLYPQPARAPLDRTRATLPASWARSEGPHQPEALLPGLSLGLFSLRTLPMMARKTERDALWKALCDVATHGHARCVVLRGPSGTGKSRLAAWLSERAEELGGATTLRAAHAAGAGSGSGLAPMLARTLRCTDMERAAMSARLTRLAARSGIVDPDEVTALAELIQPAADADVAAGARIVRFREPRERHVLIERVLARIDAGPAGIDGPRLTVVWMDDVQWGADALAFTRHLLDAQATRPSPILVVMTAQEGALVERPEEAIALEDLAMRETVDVVEVGPLPPEDHRRLVAALLDHDGPLAASLAVRTAGNPLFAVQLVGDWVGRGVLEAGPGGVHLRDDGTPTLPDDIHAVWQSRVDRLLEPFGDDDAQALELAATLGAKVTRKEWDAVCARCQLRRDRRLLDRMLVQRLAIIETDGSGWTFAHPMLRESLVRRARDQGRHPDHHRACASMLELRRAGRPGVSERVAFHLLEAGDDRDAPPYLLQAADERAVGGDLRDSLRLLDARQRAMDQGGTLPSDSARAAGWPIRLRVLRRQGRVEDATTWTRKALETANAQNWPTALAHATLDDAQLEHHRGRVDQARARLEEARSQAEDLSDRALQADVLMAMGRLCIDQGQLDDAVTTLDEARRLAGSAGLEPLEAQCWQLLGRVAKQQGDPSLAMARFTDALSVFERAGDRWGVASCTNELGEIARLQGDLDGAEVHYRDALSRMEELGADNAHIVRVNLALVMFAQKRGDVARPLVERALRAFEATQQRQMIGITHLLLTACAAAESDWTGWDVHLNAGRDLIRSTRYVEQDIALIARMAGDLATDAGWVDRARGAWILARDQWRALDRPEEVAALESLLR
jgi:eukaryotic-like serine/threonine-protein kinase